MWPFGQKLPPEPSLDEVRARCRVLFIDDETDFDIIKVLRNQSWHIEQLTDLETLDDSKLQQAHVVFVDIHGVGKALQFADEGLGVVRAIRDRFPEKMLVIYSIVSEGNRFHPSLSIADERLPKDSEPYRFLQIIEKLASRCFSPERCVERVIALVRPQLPAAKMSDKELRRAVSAIVSGRTVDAETVSRSLSVALSVADLVVKIVGLCVGE